MTPEGGKQFVLLYRANGRQRLMSLGSIDHFKSLEEARVRAGDLLNGLRKDGTDPMAQRERMADANSMQQLFEVYDTEHLANTAPSTRSGFRSSWNAHVREVLGTLAPGQVTKGDIVRLHDRVTKRSGKGAANHCVHRLRTILQWLFERNERQFPVGWRNPASGLKLHRELPRTEILDLAQQRKLVAELANEPDIFVRVYVQMLLLTGLRARRTRLAQLGEPRPR